ncbi:MAG: hypothetical protein ABSB76_04010 [Streptosporangiaceae bacterium]
MRLRTPGSFELNLDPNFRHECNQVLKQYSAFLDQFERELQARNLPGSVRGGKDAAYAYRDIDDLPQDMFSDGLYDTKAAEIVGRYWWRLFDRYRFAELIHRDLQPLDELRAQLGSGDATPAEPPGKSGRPFDAVVNTILGGFEPLDFTGHLVSLVLDQPHVRKLLSDVAPGGKDSSAAHLAFLDRTRDQQIAPAFTAYLDLIASVLADKDLTKRFLGENAKAKRDTLRGQLHRARLILVLLLGHRSQLAVDGYPGLYGYHDPFTLPHRTVVAPRQAITLFNSAALTNLAGIGLSDYYIGLLQGREQPPAEAEGEPADEAAAVAAMAQRLGEDTHGLLRFVCRGPSGRPPKPQTDDNPQHQYRPEDPDYCGWFPKAIPTHPVVFIGSPGTSKSTLMLTGLVKFYNHAHALGADVAFHSAKDEQAYIDYINSFWDGILPRPTEHGNRYSIHFRVEATDNPDVGAEFVFTDIPGEKVARSAREQGADPFVLGVLKYAETIVFLFDLTVEPAVHKALKYSPASASWDTYFENYKRVVNDRIPAAMKKNPPADERDAEANSSVRTLQLDLLDRMITDLREIRGELGEQRGPNFLCVIPKADLYAADGRVASKDADVKFLSAFYRKLRDDGVLSQSFNGPQNVDKTGLEWWHSNAGYGARLDGDGERMPVGAGMSDQIIGWQLGLVRGISAAARQGLARIGDALGKEAQEAERESLSGLINRRLIEHLESVFGESRVFFLPVSAQGADEKVAGVTQTEDGPKLGHPPNAKLAEYAFILPILLALQDAEKG